MMCLGNTRAGVVLVPVMLLISLSACPKWTVQETAPSQVVVEKQPSKIRLILLDETMVRLSEPQVIGTEIVGERMEEGYVIESDTLRIPIDSIAYVQIPEVSDTQTIGISIVAVAGAVALIIVAGWQQFWGG